MFAMLLCAIGLVSWCPDTDMPPTPIQPAKIPAMKIPRSKPPGLRPVNIQPAKMTPPSVWPLDCPIVPPAHLQPVFIQAVQRHGGGPACNVARQACIEERSFNPKAVNPVSGTIGVGQFKPDTAAELGIDPYDAVSSIFGMARYRKWNRQRWSPPPAYGRTELDAEAFTVATYNRGVGRMRQSQETYGWGTWAEAEPFQPDETINYVRMQVGDDVSWCPAARKGEV